MDIVRDICNWDERIAMRKAVEKVEIFGGRYSPLEEALEALGIPSLPLYHLYEI